MRHWRHPFKIFTAVLLSGCVRTSTLMDRWIGASDVDLVSQRGAPTRSVTLSDGSRVLTWRSTWTDVAETVQVCEESFTVSRAGIIEHWAMNNCPKYTRR